MVSQIGSTVLCMFIELEWLKLWIKFAGTLILISHLLIYSVFVNPRENLFHIHTLLPSRCCQYNSIQALEGNHFVSLSLKQTLHYSYRWVPSCVRLCVCVRAHALHLSLKGMCYTGPSKRMSMWSNSSGVESYTTNFHRSAFSQFFTIAKTLFTYWISFICLLSDKCCRKNKSFPYGQMNERSFSKPSPQV